MTCIVGIEHDGVVYVGGDSAGVYDETFSVLVRADEKVFTRDRAADTWAFGFAGSFRLGQILRYTLDLPTPDDGDDVSSFLVTDFVDAVRDALDRAGALSVRARVETAPGEFVLGYRGRLYVVEEDLQVGRSVEPYVAIGCGDMLALGSLHSTRDRPPVERITTALDAAATYSAGVRPPWHVVSTAPPARRTTKGKA